MSISPARRAAFDILKRVETQGAFAADLLHGRSSPLSQRDAALTEELVLGVLRHRAWLDHWISGLTRRHVLQLDLEVGLALRLGLYQLGRLDRIPAHAAVSDSVELVKQARKASAAGLVNAVLRKAGDPPPLTPELAVPGWLFERWRRTYGSRAEALALHTLTRPETFVRMPTGRLQDLNSQRIVPLLELAPHHTFLDLCAAPGNKTLQALESGPRLAVACDLHHHRLRQVPVPGRVVLDATHPLPFALCFDRILVDAPCSGTGTLARNPEIKWKLTPADLDDLASRQRGILRNAWEFLAPGGRLVYSTCSLEPEENEQVAAPYQPTAQHLWLPGETPGDGFFAAVLERPPSAKI
jgi:16S rRNA (cytosine967-C5)-methyltransferase